MTAPIVFDDVWKSFRRGESAATVRDVIPRLLRRSSRSPARERFWALKGVSFQAHRGETLGIIGPNGAGKTTILKLLSRLMKADRGNISVNGRLSALIELVAGFHPDLTGRENVYLSGSIFGMSRREIAANFDSIVQFAGFREFLDTPVKRYSAGMRVRLGFSVASHVDPDVLLVDEVLAVGDMAFQQKCMKRMEELRRKASTIVLVSHNMLAVPRLCSKALYLLDGQVRYLGDPSDAVAAYRRDVASQEQPGADAAKMFHVEHSRLLRLEDVSFLDAYGQPREEFSMGDQLQLSLAYRAEGDIDGAVVSVEILTVGGLLLTGMESPPQGALRKGDRARIKLTIEELLLPPGEYLVSIVAYDRFGVIRYDSREKGYTFRVTNGRGQIRGLLGLEHHWEAD